MAKSKRTPPDKQPRVRILLGGVAFAVICTLLFFVIMIVISSATVHP
ncbi:MAG: hypothetical protein ABFC84_03780 [Veillonellales bacterium]